LSHHDNAHNSELKEKTMRLVIVTSEMKRVL
jgi:hypothetical protein